MKKIACIFVNYNNSQKSIDCIDSILNQEEGDFEKRIIIVDNKSVESEYEIVEEFCARNEKIELVSLMENIGYFPALNYAITKTIEDLDAYEFLIIGNNDLIFREDFFQTLGEFETDSSMFVISPDIVNLDDNHQNPQIIVKYSLPQLVFLELYHFSYFFASLFGVMSRVMRFRSSQKSKPGFEKSQFISIGYGACYVLTKKYIQQIGELPSYLFLMNEENALSDLVFRNNGRIYYYNKLVVNHVEHSSVGQAPKSKLYKIAQKSYKISKKHFNNRLLFDRALIEDGKN